MPRQAPQSPSRYPMRVPWTAKLSPGDKSVLDTLKDWIAVNYEEYFRANDCTDMIEQFRQTHSSQGINCSQDDIQDQIDTLVRNDDLLVWLQPNLQSDRSQIDVLVAWLQRSYSNYSTTTQKQRMALLKELRGEMKNAGFYRCTSRNLQHQIAVLKKTLCSPYLRRHQLFLASIFAGDNARDGEFWKPNFNSRTETSRFQCSGRSSSVCEECERQSVIDSEVPDDSAPMKPEPVFQDGTKAFPWIIAQDVYISQPQLAATSGKQPKDEIIRISTLLRERHALEQQGVNLRLLDEYLPMPPKPQV